MATTNNDQITVETGESTPATATVNANTEQTVENTTIDDKRKLTDIQPPTIEIVPVDLPQDFHPLIASTPFVHKSMEFQPDLTNTTTIDKTISVDNPADNETKNIQTPSTGTINATNDQSVMFQISSIDSTSAEDTTILKPVNETVVGADPTNVVPQTSKQPSTTAPISRATFVRQIRKLYKELLPLALILVVSILQIIIGSHYAEKCPIHWRIPHYLVVAGTMGIVAVALITVQILLALHIPPKPTKPNLILGCGSLGLIIVFIFLFIFLIGWFIAGCIWVFRVWNEVQFKNPKRSDYCHPKLYRFAFWLLLITICYLLYFSFSIIRRIRKQNLARQKGGAIPVPTVEV